MVWGSLIGSSMALLSSRNVEPSIVGLYRHAVKGLSADSLQQVTLTVGDAFPDDRRFALLIKPGKVEFSPIEPVWLHKENFLCAFTAPELMASWEAKYQIKDDESMTESETKTKRLLTLQHRQSQQIVLDDIDLATNTGKEQLASFFSQLSNQELVCVAAESKDHSHQFGNTSSGIKSNGNSRTIHIINSETVKEISKTFGCHINPTRFRPNIVMEGLAPWEEFNWVGKKVKCGSTTLEVIKQTVRCKGVSMDPIDPDNVLDIPGMLSKFYPQYGPYLGVYAQVVESGTIQIGDLVCEI